MSEQFAASNEQQLFLDQTRREQTRPEQADQLKKKLQMSPNRYFSILTLLV
jgi:hypothetical protein